MIYSYLWLRTTRAEIEIENSSTNTKYTIDKHTMLCDQISLKFLIFYGVCPRVADLVIYLRVSQMRALTFRSFIST